MQLVWISLFITRKIIAYIIVFLKLLPINLNIHLFVFYLGSLYMFY